MVVVDMGLLERQISSKLDRKGTPGRSVYTAGQVGSRSFTPDWQPFEASIDTLAMLG